MLGSIPAGAAIVGTVVARFLAAVCRQFDLRNLREVMRTTLRASSLVFVIFFIAPVLFMMAHDPIWLVTIFGVNLQAAHCPRPSACPSFTCVT